MAYTFEEVAKASEALKLQFDKAQDKKQVLKSSVFGELFKQIKDKPADQKSAFGAEINCLKKEVEAWINQIGAELNELTPIDTTAPFDTNTPKDNKPRTLTNQNGSIHSLMSELDVILDIFYRMGFEAVESRQLDDDYHMFTSLNFPKDHPARDDYDSFMTTEGLIAPAHTSTMQNRVLKGRKNNLDNGQPIAVILPGRVFRNEDLDATHEHTFYQFEGIYVDEGINVGHLIATLQESLSEYFGQELKAKMQPFYFPFTEPSFEFAVEMPAFMRKSNSHADMWLELGGCGMIHPNVLKNADIDPEKYTGFAWGFGIERMVMMKHGIEDVRYFESGKLDFLRQF